MALLLTKCGSSPGDYLLSHACAPRTVYVSINGRKGPFMLCQMEFWAAGCFIKIPRVAFEALTRQHVAGSMGYTSCSFKLVTGLMREQYMRAWRVTTMSSFTACLYVYIWTACLRVTMRYNYVEDEPRTDHDRCLQRSNHTGLALVRKPKIRRHLLLFFLVPFEVRVTRWASIIIRKVLTLVGLGGEL